jgi:hypothetical protein
VNVGVLKQGVPSVDKMNAMKVLVIYAARIVYDVDDGGPRMLMLCCGLL